MGDQRVAVVSAVAAGRRWSAVGRNKRAQHQCGLVAVSAMCRLMDTVTLDRRRTVRVTQGRPPCGRPTLGYDDNRVAVVSLPGGMCAARWSARSRDRDGPHRVAPVLSSGSTSAKMSRVCASSSIGTVPVSQSGGCKGFAHAPRPSLATFSP